jgi:hypothetical protein
VAPPGHIYERTQAGGSVATVNTPSHSGMNDGSYHLALSSTASNATLYSLCNGECGSHLSRTTLSGGRLQNGTTGTDTTVVAAAGQGAISLDVRGLIFDPVNSTWYYGTAADASTNGEFGTVSFSGSTATLTRLLTGVPAHGLTFDPFTNDIIFSSGNQIDQYQLGIGVVATGTVNISGHEKFDHSAADGHRHLFVASNDGNLVGMDYDSALGHLINAAGSAVAERFLVANLDDIAPLSGSGAPIPEPASLALLAASLLGFVWVGRRRTRV